MADEQKFQCTGNCLNCIPAQRAYCASQHTYNNMRAIEQLLSEVLSMKDNIKSIEEKIEAMQNNEASVFETNLVTKSISLPEETAQEGDGAETIGSQVNKFNS